MYFNARFYMEKISLKFARTKLNENSEVNLYETIQIVTHLAGVR